MKPQKLAFYKESGKDWTYEEYKFICQYAGCAPDSDIEKYVSEKYISHDNVMDLYLWNHSDAYFKRNGHLILSLEEVQREVLLRNTINLNQYKE